MAQTFLQPTQVEAHISRLSAIKAQCNNYRETDGRAAEAIAAIDAVIAIFQQEPFAPGGVAESLVGEDWDAAE